MRKLFVLLTNFICVYCFSQLDTLVVDMMPDSVFSQDAVVIKKRNDGGIAENSNYYKTELVMMATTSGDVERSRAYLHFPELANIPQSATILEARLSLKGVESSGISPSGNFGNNSFVIRNIISAWNDYAVTYNAQPEVSPDPGLVVGASSSQWNHNALDIDITGAVQQMVNGSENGRYGFMLQLQNETGNDAAMVFASSEHPDISRRPILILRFIVPCARVYKSTYESHYYKGGWIRIAQDASVYTRGGTSTNWFDASNLNNGANPEITTGMWTYGGGQVAGLSRSYIYFPHMYPYFAPNPFSPNSTPIRILSARLFLFSKPNSMISPQGNCGTCPQNNNAGTDNSCWIRRVTSSWIENTITWNNAPGISTASASEIPPSQSQFNWDVISLDITDILREMQMNPTQSNGFRIDLKDESLSTNMNNLKNLYFASMEDPNRALHPRIEVIWMYVMPFREITMVLQPNPATGLDALIELSRKNPAGGPQYGNYNLFSAGVWREGSGNYEHKYHRNFLQFNLTGLPANSFVTSAKLSLYSTGSSQNVGWSASWLQRSLAPWNESTITWNNQPTTTEINRVAIPQYTSEWNYDVNLDITRLVHDKLRSGNNGMMMRCQDERWSSGSSGSAPNRWMGFASSDFATASRRPRLEVKYVIPCEPVAYLRANNTGTINETETMKKISNGIKINEPKHNSYLVTPNPAHGTTNIQFELNESSNIDITAYDISGRQHALWNFGTKPKGPGMVSLNINKLVPGIYLLKINTITGARFANLVVQ